MLNSQNRILIFDLELGGHHTDYIQYLIEYWIQNNLSGNLHIVVHPKFVTSFPTVVNLASQNKTQISFTAITAAEVAKIETKQPVYSKILKEWHLFIKYAQKLQADHGVIMHYDRYQIPLVFQTKSPCTISGVYFRPILHYHTFASYKASLRDRLRSWRDQLFLRRILHRSWFNKLFSLDPYAVPYIKQRLKTDKTTIIPDPVKFHGEAKERALSLKQHLNIEPDRTSFLLFGALARRKGIYQLFDALFLLSETTAQKISLIIVGQIRRPDAVSIESYITKIEQSLPIQIIRQNQFIAEEDIQLYFQMADVILAPYQHHMGMSGILNRAAIAGKPVLTSNFGLLGELVHQYCLGVSLDTTSPATIANGMKKFIPLPAHRLFDYDKAHQFARIHSSEQFACTIFENLRSPN